MIEVFTLIIFGMAGISALAIAIYALLREPSDEVRRKVAERWGKIKEDAKK